jgi:succinate-semialdehyde dehydrogenase / glutarate-semialdehyde dehydrogenase
MPIESINPATSEKVAEFEELTPEGIESKLSLAFKTFKEWRKTDYDHRARYMRRAGEVIRKNARKYAETITLEMGKPITQAIGEVEKCAFVCDFYADNAQKFLSRREVASDAELSYVRYDPIGPVLAVMPWNYPFWQVFRFAAPALMAGNVGVLKHASNVPASALAIEEVFLEAGFPMGAFTTLLISARATKAVVEDNRIAAVTLTGSGPAGQSVASACGNALKKTVLELGGSDPFIVLADADIPKAAKVAATSRMINTGQSCIAAKRFIVLKEVADEFAAAFKSELEVLVLGDPMDEKTDVGPMARVDLRDELHAQVERTLSEGATLVLGGKVPGGPGAFYPPTLLADVTPQMTAGKEETFGPVAPLIVVDTEDEAIEVANGTEFGLGAAVWTRDLDKAHELAQRIESGAVFVNGLVKSDPRLPFGGIKQSGYGRELSQEGIREFTNAKTVWMTS